MAAYQTEGIALDGPLKGTPLVVSGSEPAKYYYHELQRSFLSWLLRAPRDGVLYEKVSGGWRLSREESASPKRPAKETVGMGTVTMDTVTIDLANGEKKVIRGIVTTLTREAEIIPCSTHDQSQDGHLKTGNATFSITITSTVMDRLKEPPHDTQAD